MYFDANETEDAVWATSRHHRDHFFESFILGRIVGGWIKRRWLAR